MKKSPKKTINDFKLTVFFTLMWKKRPKYCQQCGNFLPKFFTTICMDHLLSKSNYPEYKFAKSNIFFCCGDCHTAKTNGFIGNLHKEKKDWATNNTHILEKEQKDFENKFNNIIKKIWQKDDLKQQ